MSEKSRLQEHLRNTLPAGETVTFLTSAQIKGGVKKQLGKALAKGIAASLAVTAATGGAAGLLVVAIPPEAWVVVTSHHLMLVRKLNAGLFSRRLGELIFAAPLEALSVTLNPGTLNEVTIADANDGQSLVRLNLGVRRNVAREIVAAVER
jgi:hypothetical protein